MSYRVEYDQNGKWEKNEETWGLRRMVIAGLCFAVFLMAVHVYWPEGRRVLLQILLPGDAVTTWNSVEQLAENLHQGIPLRYAAEKFCYEILQCGY